MAKKNIIIVFVVAVMFLLLNSFYILDQRQHALVLQFGEAISQHNTPGLKFKIPFIQNQIFFEKRIENLYAATSEVIAADQKTMRVDAFAKYKIIDPLKFFKTAQTEDKFKARLSTILDSSLRQVLGGAPFKDLLSGKRAVLMRNIGSIVNEEAQSFGVEVVDVRILRAELPENSRDAVYNRMKTEREKEAREIRAKGAEEAAIIIANAEKNKVVLLAQAAEKAKITMGEGDAEAIRIYAKSAGQDPEFFEFYRSLIAYKNGFNKDNTTMVLSTDNAFMKNFSK